jgi:nitrile hydratase
MSAGAESEPAPAEPKFRVGQTVRIRSAQVYTHIRTPWYTMGKTGVVERVVGRFPDAEKMAYGNPNGPPVVLYRIRIAIRDLWDDVPATDDGTLDVEIYEQWLEAASLQS